MNKVINTDVLGTSKAEVDSPVMHTELAAGAGAALVGFLQAGANATTRTVENRLRDVVNVKDFGAVGDNATDDTAAIQAALNSARTIYFPEGIYVVSATLTAQSDTSLIGITPEKTRLHRSTVYGDTLTVTSPAGAVEIQGLWFWHTEEFNNGSNYESGTSTNITNKDPAACHINILSGQNVRIHDCWFSGCGTQIQLTDTSIFWVTRCLFNGYWDRYVPGLQETVSSLSILSSSGSTESQLGTIRDNHFAGGGKAAPVPVTTGNVTVMKSFNCGPQYGIYVDCCESLVIADNYIGGQAVNSIFFEAKGIISHIRIHDNMMDGSALYSILFTSTSSSYLPSFISIHNNTGVGYGFEQGLVKFQDNGSGIRAGSQVSIADNVMQFYLHAPICIENAVGVRISSNIVSAYNSDGSTLADVSVQSGCMVGTSSKYVHSSGNSWGGAINNPDGPNYCKWGILFQSADSTFSCSNERSLGLGLDGGSLVGGITQTYPT